MHFHCFRVTIPPRYYLTSLWGNRKASWWLGMTVVNHNKLLTVFYCFGWKVTRERSWNVDKSARFIFLTLPITGTVLSTNFVNFFREIGCQGITTNFADIVWIVIGVLTFMALNNQFRDTGEETFEWIKKSGLVPVEDFIEQARVFLQVHKLHFLLGILYKHASSALTLRGS